MSDKQPWEVIYLQWNPDPDIETTWCSDKINDDDVVYLRMDLVDTSPSTDAIDDLWRDIILETHPDYGDWEYPGEAYRHILAEHKQALNLLEQAARDRDAHAEMAAFWRSQYTAVMKALKALYGEVLMDNDTGLIAWMPSAATLEMVNVVLANGRGVAEVAS